MSLNIAESKWRSAHRLAQPILCTFSSLCVRIHRYGSIRPCARVAQADGQ